MRKKNGFISMTIIYSFFTVFILISTSLLLIYSNNLSIVKSVNKEIKEELTTKGNNSLMIFKNLIVDGSFENYSANWKASSGYREPVHGEQRYYGNDSLGMVKEDSGSSITIVQAKEPINMIKDHYYYISRVYMAYRDINGSDLKIYLTPASSGDFTLSGGFDITQNAYGLMEPETCDSTSNTDNCRYNNRSINNERTRFQSGFCLGVNGRCNASTTSANAAQTQANTFESGVFKFTGDTKAYKFIIYTDFSSYQKTEGIFPRYYTDGYMLIDLTVAFQLNTFKAQKLFDNQVDTVGGYRVAAGKLDNLFNGRFIEDQKTYPVNNLDLN